MGVCFTKVQAFFAGVVVFSTLEVKSKITQRKAVTGIEILFSICAGEKFEIDI